MLQKAISEAGHTDTLRVQLTVLRQGAECQVNVVVPLLPSDGSARVLLWNGLLLQETPRSVHESRSSSGLPSSVHISNTFLGSPADANGIMGDFLVSVDGTPTCTLDAVVELCTQRLNLTTPASSAPQCAAIAASHC